MTIKAAARAGAAFTFRTTKSIHCEIGAARHIGRMLTEDLRLSAKKHRSVLLVTDQGIKDRGLEINTCESMDVHGLEVFMYDGVVADPSESVVHEAVDLARSVNATCVVGFGGGSSLDVAKLVAYLAHPAAKQSLQDIYGVDECHGERLPLVQVPTTAGTGSEVTPISIITTGTAEKKGVVSPVLLPDLAVLDGELTTSLPADVTAATGVDAMVHAVEAYTSASKKNMLSDMLAREALRLLGANIETAVREPDNLGVRSDMLLGSMYAGMAFANAPVAAVHALAYPIGAHFGVPHGLSNALMLPHVLRFNEPEAAALYAELAPILFGNGVSMAEGFEGLAQRLKMPTTLREVGITEKDLDLLTDDAMKQSRLLPNNPREVKRADARALYEAAL